MTTVLLTLGRLPKALDLARGFSRAGCRVLIADPFGHTLAGSSRHVAQEFTVPPPSAGKAAYLDALREIIVREGVDLVVPVSEETMHVSWLHGSLGDGVRLFTMPPEAVIRLHDKAAFVTAALGYGLSAPESHPLGTIKAQALVLAGDVVIKPVHSCSGRGVRIVAHGEALPQPDPAEPAIVQRFVRGPEFSSCTIAHDGRSVATVVYRGTVMSGSVAVAFERVEHPAITFWIERFVAASDWCGFIAFDFIVDAAGAVWAIECNPRATSGVHFWEGEDMARALLDLSGQQPVRVRKYRHMQQFYACLTETQMAMLRFRRFGTSLKRLLTARDVTWAWDDPWPFLSMIVTSWPIIRMALTEGTSFGAVATRDVGWYD